MNPTRPTVVAKEPCHWTFWKDRAGQLVYVSPSCEAITGYPPAAFLADPDLLLRIVHPDDRTRFSTHAASAMRQDHAEEIAFRILRCDGAERWIGHLCHPIRIGDQLLGTCGANRDLTASRNHELELLRRGTVLAGERDQAAALAAQQATQLRTLSWELTQVEQRERRRLAQALHDHLQQILVAARLKLKLLGRQLHDDSGRGFLQQIDGMLNDAITETRSLTTRLAPAVLDEIGLSAALEWLAQQMKQTFDLDVQLTLDPTAKPEADDARALLFLSVREVLFNVVKHAQVQMASVEVRRIEDDLIQIVVIDAGRGFDPAPFSHSILAPSGFGLASVRQRLELIGGHLDIRSAPGRGTRVTLSVPGRRFAPTSPLHSPSAFS